MIVQALKVVLEEAEIAARVREALGGVSQLKEVTVALGDGSVSIGGKFQAGLAVPFQTAWSAEVLDSGRKLGVRLTQVKVSFFGLSGANLSNLVMGALAQKAQDVPGVAVDGDRIVLEPALLLAARGVRLEGRIRRFAVSPGRVEIEAGA